MAERREDALWIYVESRNPRVAYTFALLFEWVFPLSYRLTSEVEEWRNYSGPRLSYCRMNPDHSIPWLPAGVLLFESGIRVPEIKLEQEERLPCLFHRPAEGAVVPFDLPAMAFYLATRYEEYLPYTADRHGRFPASQSLASRAGFLHIPVINRWVGRLVDQLKDRYPSWLVTRPAFRYLPTFDIDLAWAFLHRPWWVQAGGMGKALLQGRWVALRKRLETLRGRRPDPFFTFPLLRRLHPPGGSPEPVFFFLLGDYGSFDKNIPPSDPAFRSLVAGLARDYRTGIHLSYRSNREKTQIPVEIGRLAEISGLPVVRNRQHFLKLHLPETYRRLLSNGIREDYSMGYADDIGFRAGLANPFPWYDLERETSTSLIVYPFQVMDVTLKNYLQWTPAEAWGPVRNLLEETYKAGGVFCTLWHNSSFGELEGWRPWIAFYQRLVEEATRLS
jgi:hypothetical protein